VTAYDLPSYRAAFEAGAFFAIVDDHEVKGAYPRVTNVFVTSSAIALATADADETVTWIGNGSVVGAGMSLSLQGLPPGLVYVRAEIADPQGRLAYTQPFSLEPGTGATTALEEIQSGASSASSSVSTSVPEAGVVGDLYLAAISFKRNVSVIGVSGLGLTWSPVRTQCGARGQTGVSVWQARGHVTGDGGTDTDSYAFGFATASPGSLVYLAAALRNKDHTAGAGYTERIAVYAGSGGSTAGLATADGVPGSIPGASVHGGFSSTVDYGVVAVEIQPLPEPDAIAMLESGAATLWALRRRRKE